MTLLKQLTREGQSSTVVKHHVRGSEKRDAEQPRCDLHQMSGDTWFPRLFEYHEIQRLLEEGAPVFFQDPLDTPVRLMSYPTRLD